ncbi:MAG TPA: hypothetical protein DCQ83_00225 [Fibrobacteres bacterium]|jgi:glycosyltransferase involved in cell wall biosynthesis|nr:hypothetical protein [Fibrobacterota bacterium]
MYDVILTCNYSPWSSYRGGGQKSTHMIASTLATMGKKVCVIYSKGVFERVALPEDLPYDVVWAFFFAIKPGISSPLRFLNGISFYLKTRKLSGSGTVLHGNGEEASLLRYVRNKKRFVFSLRYPGFEPFMYSLPWNKIWVWPYVFLREPRHIVLALALRGADAVMCTSASSKESLLACFRISEQKTRIIPNGIDPVFLATRFEWKEQNGILYFGRLTHAKGVDVLLRAYAGLEEATKQIHPLKIIGDGPYVVELKRLASELHLEKRVEWQAWVGSQELAHEIVSHRLVALPSREESFGNTMLETLATGQSLISTNAGSIPEVTEDHAVLVPRDDVDALRRAISECMSKSPSREDIEARYRYVRERFSWETTSQMYLKSYEE